jgi:TolB-like protein/tetratricopeptide (TPR) repeat protein
MRPSELDPERWKRIDAVLDRALETPPEGRPALLDEICVGDDDLRVEVEALLEAHARAEERFDEPVSPLGAGILASSAAETQEGRRVGPFRIVREIGRGGMGVVYLAEDTRLGRHVALKALPPYLGTGPDARRRFVAEAQAVSALDHTNVATLHAIDTTDEGQLYMVFAYYPGETLAERISRGAVPPDEAIEIVSGIAAGLGAAHQRGIIHRDVKPSNVLLTTDGGIKLLDFGVAKMAGEDLTGSGVPLGTVAYMSPEQLRSAPLDSRTDLWSLGVVLYEMLTAERPFEGADPAALLESILNGEPKPLSSVAGSVPEALQHIVGRLLSKAPEERYHGAAELLEELEVAVRVGEELPARPAAPPIGERSVSDRPAAPIGGWRYSRRVALLGVAASVVAVAVWLGSNLTGPAVRVDSLAVLPLENLTGDVARQYLADGIHDALIAELGGVASLDVRSRTSVLRFRSTDMTIPEIAGELGVDGVVEGGVFFEGDSLAVTIRLIRASPERRLFAQTYRGSVGDVFEISGGAAMSIAAELDITLSPEAEARLASDRHVDEEAFRAYWSGIEALDRRSPEGYALAERYFRRAIDVDRGFAQAYASLAGVRGSSAFLGLRAPAETLPEVSALVDTALSIDSGLAEAHVQLAHVRLYWEWDVVGAEAAVEKALELAPKGPQVHRALSEVRAVQRDYAEALAEVELAEDLEDPQTQWSAFRPVVVLNYMREFDDAIRRARHGLELFPDFWIGYWLLCQSLAGAGQYTEAVEQCETAAALANRTPVSLGTLGFAHARNGESDEALRIADELERRADVEYVPGTIVAVIYAGLGDRDRAFFWLDRAYDDRDITLVHVPIRHYFDSLRADDRYQDLLRRMGLDRVSGAGGDDPPRQ